MHPFIFFGNGYYIPSYLLVISLTYSLLLVWVYLRAQKKNLPTSTALDYSLMIMVGGFLGGRLFHVFYENWNYYQLFPWDILKIWQGGFVYYGGAIGALLAAAIYSKWTKNDLWFWTDFFAPMLAVGYAVGRIGCLLNGCCFGEVCDLPWAIEFNQPGLPSGLRHPTQAYATLWELLITFPLVYQLPKTFSERFSLNGQIFGVWLVSHGLGRILMERFRDDFRGAEFLNTSVSTWLGLLSMAFGIALVRGMLGSAKARVN